MHRSTIFALLSLFLFGAFVNQQPPQQTKASTREKELAFEVLKLKCNSCHDTRNRKKLFTPSNMDGHAPAIHRQVFIKKRMPKKGGTPLTELEKQVLLTWLHPIVSQE